MSSDKIKKNIIFYKGPKKTKLKSGYYFKLVWVMRPWVLYRKVDTKKITK
jgi:hypothetical protein